YLPCCSRSRSCSARPWTPSPIHRMPPSSATRVVLPQPVQVAEVFSGPARAARDDDHSGARGGLACSADVSRLQGHARTREPGGVGSIAAGRSDLRPGPALPTCHTAGGTASLLE